MDLDEVIDELTRLRDQRSGAHLFAKTCDGRPFKITAVDTDEDGDIIIHID